MAIDDISFTSNSNSFWDMVLEIPLGANGNHVPVDISFGSKRAPSKFVLETFLSREVIIITVN